MEKCFGNFVNMHTYRILYPRNLNFSSLHLWIPRAMRHQRWSMDKHTNGIKECVIITHTQTQICVRCPAPNVIKANFSAAREQNCFRERRILSSSSNNEAFIKTTPFPRKAREKSSTCLRLNHPILVLTLFPLRGHDTPISYVSAYVCTEWNAASITDLDDETKRCPVRNSNQLGLGSDRLVFTPGVVRREGRLDTPGFPSWESEPVVAKLTLCTPAIIWVEPLDHWDAKKPERNEKQLFIG